MSLKTGMYFSAHSILNLPFLANLMSFMSCLIDFSFYLFFISTHIISGKPIEKTDFFFS